MPQRYTVDTPTGRLPCPSDVGHDPANDPEPDIIGDIMAETRDLDHQETAELIADLRDELREAKIQRDIARRQLNVQAERHADEVDRLKERIAQLARDFNSMRRVALTLDVNGDMGVVSTSEVEA